MKNITVLILIITLFSCSKVTPDEVSPDQEERNLEICTIDTASLRNQLLMSGRPLTWQVPPIRPTSNPLPVNPEITPETLIGSSSACILLDFNGQVVTSRYWNSGRTISCASSGLSASSIATVLAKVRANYAAYNVVITDQESVYNASNPAKRQRVIVTPTSSWYPGVGGVSYVGSLTFGDGTPTFVFSDRMYYNANYVGETISHEAGHAVGLLHQSIWTSSCILSNVYAPNVIMGNSLLGIAGRWTNGTTQVACNNYQNDNAVLTTKLGLK